MVLGIGEGSIDIIVDKTAFQKGETIKGKVVLRLNQPKKAKELRIALIAEREEHYRNKRGRKSTRKIPVYRKQTTLDGEKEYPAGERSYDFEFVVADFGGPLPEAPLPDDGVGRAIAGLVAAVETPSAFSWRLDASLNLPMAFDINKKLPISVA